MIYWTIIAVTVALSIGIAGILIAVTRKAQLKRLAEDHHHFPSPQSRYCEVDGVKLHYVVHGNGPHVILLHGIGAHVYCWRKLIPLLAPHYRVWAIDLMGFGNSDKPKNRSYGVKAQAKLVEGLMQKLNIEESIFVGSSMGSAIALQVAADYPRRMSHLVMCSAALNPDIVPFDLRLLRPLSKLATPFINRRFVERILKRVYAPGTPVEGSVVNAYLTPYVGNHSSVHSFIQSMEVLLDKELLTHAKMLRIPTLLIWGHHDIVVPVKYAHELKRTIPNAVLEIHPDAGHHPQEEVAEWLAEKIHAFARPPAPNLEK